MAMTEINFSRDQSPDVRRFNLDTDNDKATQINVPDWVRKITIRPEARGCRISFTTASDDINADFIKLSADTPSEFSFTDGHRKTNKVTKVYVSNLNSYSTAMAVAVMIEGA